MRRSRGASVMDDHDGPRPVYNVACMDTRRNCRVHAYVDKKLLCSLYLYKLPFIAYTFAAL